MITFFSPLRSSTLVHSAFMGTGSRKAKVRTEPLSSRINLKLSWLICISEDWITKSDQFDYVPPMNCLKLIFFPNFVWAIVSKSQKTICTNNIKNIILVINFNFFFRKKKIGASSLRNILISLSFFPFFCDRHKMIQVYSTSFEEK